jgi:hypothetical protein
LASGPRGLLPDCGAFRLAVTPSWVMRRPSMVTISRGGT